MDTPPPLAPSLPERLLAWTRRRPVLALVFAVLVVGGVYELTPAGERARQEEAARLEQSRREDARISPEAEAAASAAKERAAEAEATRWAAEVGADAAFVRAHGPPPARRPIVADPVREYVNAQRVTAERADFQRCTGPEPAPKGYRYACEFTAQNRLGVDVRHAGEFFVSGGRVVEGRVEAM